MHTIFYILIDISVKIGQLFVSEFYFRPKIFHCIGVEEQPDSFNQKMPKFIQKKTCQKFSLVKKPTRKKDLQHLHLTFTEILHTCLCNTSMRLFFVAESLYPHCNYRHSSISSVLISVVFDLPRFIILSYFPPL